MASYQTNQKKELIAFLEKNRDRAFTIEEIVQAMEADSQFSIAPGKSTIYRLMSALVENNIVKRFNTGTGRKAAYQIIGGKSCRSHIHLKCTYCGRLFHMSDEDSQVLTETIREKLSFSIDLTQTLIYGLCADCLTSSQEEEFAYE